MNQIDTKFCRPHFSSSFLIKHNDKYSLVEVGSTLSVPGILEFLKEKNINHQDVKNVFVTHIHLDHAGGAGLLLKSLTNAKLYVHQAGVQHMIDPHSKLVPGALDVYGEKVFNQDYPGIEGIPKERVVGCKDGDIVDDAFQFIEAHGHAFHHGMWFYKPDRILFTGDGFGFGFKEINLCPLLCTSPSQFDYPSWKQTVEKVRALGKCILQPTHFDQIEYNDKTFKSVCDQLEKYNHIVQTATTREEVKEEFIKVMKKELDDYGYKGDFDRAYFVVFGDLSVDGLWFRVQKRLQKSKA